LGPELEGGQVLVRVAAVAELTGDNVRRPLALSSKPGASGCGNERLQSFRGLF
jgi:hypothetical protein